MLRLLFQSLEQSLGSSLSQAAFVIYWIGVMLLAYAVLVPVYRIVMDYAAARRGLEQHWVMTCRNCGNVTLVRGRLCAHCDWELDIPWTLKRWAALPARHRGKWARRLKWAGHLFGSAGFLLLSIWVITAIGALSPQGEIGFEYLQLDHELLGYHHIVSVGFSSGERVPLPRNAIALEIVNHLRQHAVGYTNRGLTVRLRTEHIVVSPDQSYEVIQRE